MPCDCPVCRAGYVVPIFSLGDAVCMPARRGDYFEVTWECGCRAFCAGMDAEVSWAAKCTAHAGFMLVPTDERTPGPAPDVRPQRRRAVTLDATECEHCGAVGECDSCDGCDRCSNDCECRHCERCEAHSSELEVCSACDRCVGSRGCCNCTVCDGCDRRGMDVSLCEECERCYDRCCECWTCEGCDTRYRPRNGGQCSECERCSDCCDGCNEASGLLREREPKFYTPDKSQRKRNPSARLLGVEIEVAGCSRDTENVSDAAETWHCSIVEDGSLPSSGFEITTSPAGGDLFVEQIEDLCTALKKAGAKITNECGLHVHVDARDFRYYDMRRLVLLYAKIETALFATQPRSRRGSTYCEPCGEQYARHLDRILVPRDSKTQLIRNVYGTSDTRPAKKNKYHGARYHALNLHSWIYRGTVECRLHTGSVEARKIVAWGMLWAAILDYAMAESESAIKRLWFASLEAQQTFLLDVIAPNDEVRAYLRERWETHSGSAPAARSEVA